jgi:hypothetical protein
MIESHKYLTEKQVLQLIDEPEVSHDTEKLILHLQDLLDDRKADFALLANVLQELVKQGSITQQEVPRIIQELQ